MNVLKAMSKKTKLKPEKPNWLQTNTVRVARAHFAFIAAYMISIVVFDSWNLYTHEAVSNRWSLAGALLVLNTVVWYVGRMKFSSPSVYVNSVLLLIAADIIFSGMNVYWERGLASKSVILFVVSLITAATLRSRSTLLAASALATAAYSTAAVRYFYQHYGESFRVELYGYISFYCGLFFVLAWLLWVIVRPTQERL